MAAPGDDFELGHVRDGYPSLASWIARDPDGETLIFRKFTRLASRNILHLQSKLVELEHEIDQLDNQARRSVVTEERQASRLWETFIDRAKDPQSLEAIRLRKAEEVSAAIKEYYEAVVLQAKIAGLQQPERRAYLAFENYILGQTTSGKSLPIISSKAKDSLLQSDDLMALRKPWDEDVLSSFLRDKWTKSGPATHDPLDRTTIYSNSKVANTVSAISMLVAAVLMVAAITSLYVVSSENARLGMIAAFTVLFAASVALLTSAKRVEVYASTAAYAAVLVVFVSGNLGQQKEAQCLVQTSQGVYRMTACPS